MSFAVLIPLSIGLGVVGLAAFFWALRNGQYDDPDGAAWRVIPTDIPQHMEGRKHGHVAPDPEDRDAGGRL
ncbi:MAG: cbb3-type cytochrome oxidase assembly protein CcoS [Flavobacteriaceae bacterium]